MSIEFYNEEKQTNSSKLEQGKKKHKKKSKTLLINKIEIHKLKVKKK